MSTFSIEQSYMTNMSPSLRLMLDDGSAKSWILDMHYIVAMIMKWVHIDFLSSQPDINDIHSQVTFFNEKTNPSRSFFCVCVFLFWGGGGGVDHRNW